MYSAVGRCQGGPSFRGSNCKLTVLKSFSNELPFKLNEGDLLDFFDGFCFKKSFDTV